MSWKRVPDSWSCDVETASAKFGPRPWLFLDFGIKWKRFSSQIIDYTPCIVCITHVVTVLWRALPPCCRYTMWRQCNVMRLRTVACGINTGRNARSANYRSIRVFPISACSRSFVHGECTSNMAAWSKLNSVTFIVYFHWTARYRNCSEILH